MPLLGLLANTGAGAPPGDGGDGFVFTDDFNRADEDLEASADWTRIDGVAGAIKVESNALTWEGNSTNSAYRAPDIGSANMYAQYVLGATVDSNGCFLVIGLEDASNFALGVRPNGGNWQLFYRDGGTLTELDTTPQNAPETARLERFDGAWRLLIDDVEKLSGILGLLPDRTWAGLMDRGGGGTGGANVGDIDDFECGELVAADDWRTRVTRTAAFEDDFNRANENLEASADWTRVDGAAGAVQVENNAVSFKSTTETAYQLPDQGSADHWSEAKLLKKASVDFFPVCVRVTDKDNFIGCRYRNGVYQIHKRDGGSFTLLGEVSGYEGYERVRLEAQGDTIRLYLHDIEVFSTTESFNNTETRQGLIARGSTEAEIIDDFKAGTL